MKLLAPLASFLVLSFPSASAQTWMRVLAGPGDDLVHAVRELPNGNVAVLHDVFFGSGRLSILDASGQALSTREFTGGATGLDVLANGDLALAGSTLHPYGWYGVCDGAGAVVWSDQHQDGQFQLVESTFAAALVTSTGDLVFTGWTAEDDCDRELFVVRTDAAGNVAWQSRLGSASAYFVGNHAVELLDGSFAVGGATTFGRPFVARLDAAGNVLWKRSFVRAGAFDPWARLAATTDGEIVLVQGQWADNPGFCAFRLGAAGNVLWQRSYPGSDVDVAADVQPTSDGGCLVVGRSASFGAGASDVRLLRLDAAGDVVWQRVLGGLGEEQGVCLSPTADGGWLVGGRVRSGADWDGLVLRLDANGEVQGCPSGVAWAAPAAEAADVLDPQGPTQFFDFLVEAGPTSGVLATADWQAACLSAAIGANYCSPAQANSTGVPAALSAWGSDGVSDNDLTLAAVALPLQKFGYFLTGMGNAASAPPGSQGILCLNGATIHRFASQVQSSKSVGAFGQTVDLTNIPGHGAVFAGETWNFQAWYRDVNPTPTSNFTDAVSVSFL